MRPRLLGLLFLPLIAAQPGREAAPPPAPSDVPSSAPSGAEQADIIGFRDDGEGRMTVPVTINGSGPYRFLVDTGAERSVISSALAERLRLEAGPHVRLLSMTDATLVPTALVDELRMSRNAVHEVAALSLDGYHLGASGLLGTDALQSHRVTFDFASREMKIVPSRERRERWERNDTIVVTARRKNGRLILTDAFIDGYRIPVIVDTGSNVTIGNLALRDKLFGRKNQDQFRPVELISVTGGRMIVPWAPVQRIRLGHVEIEYLHVAFGDLQPFRKLGYGDRPALLLGMDAFKLFGRVSIDFGKREIRLLKPDAAAAIQRKPRYAAGDPRPGAR